MSTEILDHKGSLCCHLQGDLRRLYILGSHMVLQIGTNDFESFPSGHFLRNPIRFTDQGATDDHPFQSWLHDPLLEVFSARRPVEIRCDKHNECEKSGREAVLLNCLDKIYGHAFYKLLNVDIIQKNHPGLDVIVLIHRALSWMVPEGVEQWVVDVPFGLQDEWLEGLESFVVGELGRFSKLHLAPLVMSFKMEQIDLQRFISTRPFPFQNLRSTPLQISIVLRDDRFWLCSRWNSMLFLATLKWHLLKYCRPYFRRLQQRNYNRLIRILRRRFPDIRFKALGMATQAKLEVEEDLCESYEAYIEHEPGRCEIYAQSQIAIGVLGSHMLLPSYLAAGFISLTPTFKIPNFAEDYVPRADEPVTRRI